MSLTKINEAKAFIESQLAVKPTVGMILGSGLGVLADEIINPVKIKYDEIPHFLRSTVEGHAGQFVIGELNGVIVMAMQGRFHFYEGYSQKDITFPVRVMKALGIETIFVTNAAGGVNTSYVPGDLMIIDDHINFSGSNPLIGENEDELGPRFPDTSTAYTPALIALAHQVADEQGLALKQGVYQYNSGPTYETPAEVRMARILGADAVGMSTAPEVIVAAHMGMRVLGISCITNMAAGILDQPLHHGEVVETAERVRSQFIGLIKGVLAKL
ncbi:MULTISPECIES: purine-nucleoside phosphorylase [unclassified Fusibacter]|uniref:purine-nucleoside phosphorylase n=1 Tax=unclassified Fusibacter TaxID=2624464 RepID=UPI001010DBCE|nr:MULTISPECIES: purine-nucleoside phosphorylase [unclassified Fusibacter]MCK8058872.1 purine-nucleoside phosphorylase [Fusibacter sp. A2]NPE21947.1 purine-nucleoside phosphorylase [Fusibacter sp. A1]RXV61515.1 purine-nucleoside phosphorylase [Fusibacter sp. A1]